jgi:hypothetical protein
LNNTKQTNSGAQLRYPYVRYLPNASKKHFLTARPKGSRGPDGRWFDLGNGFGVYLSDENKRMAMEPHSKLDTPAKLQTAKRDLPVFFKGHCRRGGNKSTWGSATKAAVRNGAARRNAKNHLIGDDGFPGSGFMDHLLCNHIRIMAELIDSQGLVAVNSVYIKQDQLHGDNEFVCIDTEWSHARWEYGPDGFITEFGAANAEDSVLVTGLQPIPSAGRERTKKTRELRDAMEWVIDRCPD